VSDRGRISGGRRSGPGLVWHQYRYDRRTFRRDPASVFFTVALPLIFLFLFVSIFGNDTAEVEGREIRGATYYVPSILALALVSATTVNLAISVSILRERGVLKRLRSTPLPPWVYMAGRTLTATTVAVAMVVVVTGLGWLAFGVTVPTGTLPGLAATVLVGTAALCCLGFALTAAIPSEDAAPAITNAVILPLYFISGIFIPDSQIPAAMRAVADVFPVKHLFQALLAAFDPVTAGTGIEPGHLAVLGAWGVAGLLVATRTFRWAPRAGRQ
jgi:ABC-2 type transport system permease protein